MSAKRFIFRNVPPGIFHSVSVPPRKIWEVFRGLYIQKPLRGPYEIHKGLYKTVKSSLRLALIQTGRGRASHCTACEFRRVENAARVKQQRESRERERPREDLETGGIEGRESGCLRAKKPIEEYVAGGSNANRDTVSGNGAPRCGARSGDGLLREASGHLFLGSDYQAVCRRCPGADSSAGYSHWP